jgi:hypothetical protein
VKEGLAQCYKGEIEDLRAQLSEYTSLASSDENRNSDRYSPPPSRMEPKLVTEITSEIIILEEDESLEETERKGIKDEDITSEREDLRRRVEYLETVIQGLEQEIEQLKWTKESPENEAETLV